MWLTACPQNCLQCTIDSLGASTSCWDQQCAVGFGLLRTSGTTGGTCVGQLIVIIQCCFYFFPVYVWWTLEVVCASKFLFLLLINNQWLFCWIDVACGTGCAKCIINSDGSSSVCTACKSYYSLQNGQCNGTCVTLLVGRAYSLTFYDSSKNNNHDVTSPIACQLYSVPRSLLGLLCWRINLQPWCMRCVVRSETILLLGYVSGMRWYVTSRGIHLFGLSVWIFLILAQCCVLL